MPLSRADEPPTHSGSSNQTPGTRAAAGLPNPFAAIETSQDLQTLFMMFPRLRCQLRDIHHATLPPTEEELMEQQLDERESASRGRGRGRGRGGRGGGRGPWTQERGTKNGVRALQNAKGEYGKGGEGMREFADLVLRLISGDDGPDGMELVQQEVMDENTKIIAQLLSGESG